MSTRGMAGRGGGPRAVEKWIRSHRADDDARELGAAEAARRAGVARNMIWEWISGRRRPSLSMAFHLERVSGGLVPVTAWDDGGAP